MASPRFSVFSSLLLLLCGALTEAQDWAALDTYIETKMGQSGIPGLSIAVVKGEETLYMKGFGKADVENDVPATENTLFHAGSVTKSFAATLLALIMYEKRVHPDTQIRDIIPEFSMMDEFATAATVKDLLTLQMGLSRHDIAWFVKSGPMSRADLPRLLKYLTPEVAFRYEPRYNNWMYALAGHLAEVLAGGDVSWESLLQDRLLTPLGMNSSLPSGVDDAFATGQYAAFYQGGVRLPQDTNSKVDGVIAPAGSVISSAVDMARYVRMHVNGGVVDGQQVLSPEVMAYLHSGTRLWGDSGVYSPGALVVTEAGGRRFLWHNGQLSGTYALVWMDMTDPAAAVGVAIMVNMGGDEPQLPVQEIAITAINVAQSAGLAATASVGDPSHELAKAMLDVEPMLRTPARVETKERLENHRRLNEPFANWVGEYRHPFYGWLNVTANALTYGDYVGVACIPDCSVEWPIVSGSAGSLGSIGAFDFVVRPERNMTGAVVGLAISVAQNMPTAGTQMITFVSQDYAVATDQGWPRWQPVGEQRPVHYAGMGAPRAPGFSTPPGFSTLEVILVSVIVAWAVPVVGAGVWQCMRRDGARVTRSAPSQELQPVA